MDNVSVAFGFEVKKKKAGEWVFLFLFCIEFLLLFSVSLFLFCSWIQSWCGLKSSDPRTCPPACLTTPKNRSEKRSPESVAFLTSFRILLGDIREARLARTPRVFNTSNHHSFSFIMSPLSISQALTIGTFVSLLLLGGILSTLQQFLTHPWRNVRSSWCGCRFSGVTKWERALVS